MNRNSFNQRKTAYDFGEDRYQDLLHEAEQYRLEQRAVQSNVPANKPARRAMSPIALRKFERAFRRFVNAERSVQSGQSNAANPSRR